MKTRVEHRANRTIVYARGSLDAVGAPLLEEAVRSLAESSPEAGRTPIYVDLSDVDHLTSAGISVLLFLLKMPMAGGEAESPARPMPLVRLVNLSKTVRDLLHTTHILGPLERGELGPKPSRPAEPAEDYRHVMDRIREAFPAPVSEPVRDEQFVRTISRGLERIDALKSTRPYLGERVELDYDQARHRRLPEGLQSVEGTIEQLADYLQGLVIFGHPDTQENVVPPTTIPSIVGQMFGSIYNPNVIWDEYSHRVAQAEVEVASMCASLVGYDPARASGFFTFGGTGTVLYGVKLGLEKALPGSFAQGLAGQAKLVSSDAGHYAKLNVLGWLGLGTDNLVTVATDMDNAMGLKDLETELRTLLDAGQRIACIIATMGTTDSFGIDNIGYVVGLRDRLADEYGLDYRPHVHADAVIGWPWAVFNDYDFDANPMAFGRRTLRSLWDARTIVQHMAAADSIGVDFHKTGYGPYVTSMFLVKDSADLSLITRDPELMPYLYQFGTYHPGVFTLESSRSGGAVLASLANLKLLGKTGYRAILGHIVTMAERLRAHIERHPRASLVNTHNYGPVTLFRVYPDGLDADRTYLAESTDSECGAMLARHNEYNRRVFAALHRQMEAGEGPALSFTQRYRTAPSGEPILALKSFVMSPFVDDAAMERLIACLERARREADASA